MAQHQLELFPLSSEEFDDQFFIIEVEEPGESEYYPLGPVIDAVWSVYGYITCYLLVFLASAWLGMLLGDIGYLSPSRAFGDLAAMFLMMLVVPVFWPFLIVSAVCFFFPIRRDTPDAMALSLVALSISNLAAFAWFADIFGAL